MRFVGAVTREGSSDYIPPAERIAAFDNDGTLWAEHPHYFQALFTLDRVKMLAAKHPEWKDREPFASLFKGNMDGITAGGKEGIAELIMSTHAGMTTTEFEQIVEDWISTAKHPKTGRLYTEMTYEPMLELLAYLRANEFKTYIVSAGGIEFMRPWTERVYGIPPEQVIGSSVKTQYEIRDGKSVLIRLPEMLFIDDKSAKPVTIHSHLGRQPVAAFGNSDGDQQMLEWTQCNGGRRLMVLLHHDDAEREWAYGAQSRIGTFSDALMSKAKKEGWVVISMKNDWKIIFPFEKK